MRKGAQSPVLDDDDEDDTFDTRMRLTFLKKCRSSGRRHTVANIGLPDMPGVRRGSLENGRGSGNVSANSAARKAQDYQYVRKWSVDITALANQLENPKGHAGSYPVLAKDRSKSDNNSNDDQPEVRPACKRVDFSDRCHDGDDTVASPQQRDDAKIRDTMMTSSRNVSPKIPANAEKTRRSGTGFGDRSTRDSERQRGPCNFVLVQRHPNPVDGNHHRVERRTEERGGRRTGSGRSRGREGPGLRLRQVRRR